MFEVISCQASTAARSPLAIALRSYATVTRAPLWTCGSDPPTTPTEFAPCLRIADDRGWADGNAVHPFTVDEFRMGPAEIYEVVIQPSADLAYTIFAPPLLNEYFFPASSGALTGADCSASRYLDGDYARMMRACVQPKYVLPQYPRINSSTHLGWRTSPRAANS